jgi:hypothetical protein
MLVGNSSESTWVLGEQIGNIHGNLMGTWIPPPSNPHPSPKEGKTIKRRKVGPPLGHVGAHEISFLLVGYHF